MNWGWGRSGGVGGGVGVVSEYRITGKNEHQDKINKRKNN
jgi:hypothetical protein